MSRAVDEPLAGKLKHVFLEAPDKNQLAKHALQQVRVGGVPVGIGRDDLNPRHGGLKPVVLAHDTLNHVRGVYQRDFGAWHGSTSGSAVHRATLGLVDLVVVNVNLDVLAAPLGRLDGFHRLSERESPGNNRGEINPGTVEEAQRGRPNAS